LSQAPLIYAYDGALGRDYERVLLANKADSMEEVREVEGSTNESDSDYDEGQDTKGSNKDDAKSLEEEGK